MVYTRRGRTVCPGELGTQLVYDGYIGGTAYNTLGGGANFLCMTKDPIDLQYRAGVQGHSILLGTEYDAFPGTPLSAVYNNMLHVQYAKPQIDHLDSRNLPVSYWREMAISCVKQHHLGIDHQRHICAWTKIPNRSFAVEQTQTKPLCTMLKQAAMDSPAHLMSHRKN